jgi:hypothetical protein
MEPEKDIMPDGDICYFPIFPIVVVALRRLE